MSTDDILYYRHRVQTERGRAAEAPTPEIAAVHEKLAHLYESLVERMERSPAEQDLSPLDTDSRQSH